MFGDMAEGHGTVRKLTHDSLRVCRHVLIVSLHGLLYTSSHNYATIRQFDAAVITGFHTPLYIKQPDCMYCASAVTYSAVADSVNQMHSNFGFVAAR